MRLKMVGTGSISGQSRSASTLVDENILVDCGNGIVKTIPEQYISKIDVLLITHLHGDHFLDVIFLIFCRYFNQVNNTLNIYCPRNTEKIVREIFNLTYPEQDLVQLFKKARVKFIEFDMLQNEVVSPGYSVTSYPVEHGKITAYGFTIKHDDTVIGFSGDSTYCKNIDYIMEKSDAVVLDVSFIASNRTHMGLDTLRELIRKYPRVIIISTHMCDDTRQAAQKLDYNNLIVPQDAQEIIIEHNSML